MTEKYYIYFMILIFFSFTVYKNITILKTVNEIFKPFFIFILELFNALDNNVN